MACSSKVEKWRFCSVCKRNHEEGRKHIFSTGHKAKLSQILVKFIKKVRSARRCLNQPSLLEGECEPGAMGKMWCYCCEQEVQKHVTDTHVSIEWAGLLEHLAEPDHHKKTRKFWWMHGADPGKLQTFLLYAAEYKKFKERVRTALADLEERKKERREQLAVRMKAEEDARSAVAMEPPQTGKDIKSSEASISKKRNKSVTWDLPRKNGGTSSVSQKLTSIAPKQVPGVWGNVHTGATPPWLREDESDEITEEVSTQIGPSRDDFILHKEKQKRAKRNPNRVGADFHIKLATQKQLDPDSWLPSFGRVWNAGSRFQSKEEFLQEVGTSKVSTTKPPSGTSTASEEEGDVGGSLVSVSKDLLELETTSDNVHVTIKPYVRCRKSKTLS